MWETQSEDMAAAVVFRSACMVMSSLLGCLGVRQRVVVMQDGVVVMQDGKVMHRNQWFRIDR